MTKNLLKTKILDEINFRSEAQVLCINLKFLSTIIFTQQMGPAKVRYKRKREQNGQIEEKSLKQQKHIKIL